MKNKTYAFAFYTGGTIIQDFAKGKNVTDAIKNLYRQSDLPLGNEKSEMNMTQFVAWVKDWIKNSTNEQSIVLDEVPVYYH